MFRKYHLLENFVNYMYILVFNTTNNSTYLQYLQYYKEGYNYYTKSNIKFNLSEYINIYIWDHI